MANFKFDLDALFKLLQEERLDPKTWALCAIAERLEEGVKQLEKMAAALEWVKERQL
ncbi:hypothetical protein LCGC14_0992960 [marine sediment metagenome]|uniref:Uncharacterized protein n=1 Tax=marine sediment metagenome TaxID=412755 RepID=A0A0F9RBQ3_9ZZZZ